MPAWAEWLGDKALTLVLIPVITALGGYLVAALNAWRKNSTAKKHLSQLQTLILAAVEDMNQTEVDGLKGTPDWTEERQQEIFQAVKSRVLAQLKTDTQKALAEAYANPDQFIEMEIERIVRAAKNNKGVCSDG